MEQINTTEGIQLDYLPRMPQDKSRAIGCIGSGFIMADCHLVAYRQAGFNPVAIASRNREHSKAVADRNGIEKVYNTYQELLNDTSISILDVAVPPQTELEIIREAVSYKRYSCSETIGNKLPSGERDSKLV